MNNLKSIEIRYNHGPVGKLGLTDRGICVFEYDKEFLQTGFSISPFELPLKPGVFTAKAQPFDGGFGVFDDSMPDGWGLLVLDRYLKQHDINPNSLNLIDRLALVGSSGRGALEFFPDKSVENDLRNTNIDLLAKEAQEILKSDQYQGKGIEEFQKRGGSPGGARPKIFMRDNGKEWMVKFRANPDPQDIGIIEYKYSQLAKECGIEMPETRLFENKYFGTERFDRNCNGKLHVVSMAGLLRADYRLPSIDYFHIFQVAMVLTKNLGELWKIYRLMVFNYLIENKDDHAKNFSFIYKEDGWHFAPAYDLLPSSGFNGYHTTSINDKINPQKQDLIELATKVNMDKKMAIRIYEEIEEIIRSNA